MKNPSEIWDSFSEAKGEKKAYVVGIEEGLTEKKRNEHQKFREGVINKSYEYQGRNY